MGTNPLIGHVTREMEALNRANCDTWLSKVEKIENTLKTPKNIFFNPSSGKKILKHLKSKFDRHFLTKINEFKQSNNDTFDHNKLRTYKTFKSSFTREPYLNLVTNRNQRCYLSRLRVGSHRLNIELGRHTRPITPAHQRYCKSVAIVCHVLTDFWCLSCNESLFHYTTDMICDVFHLMKDTIFDLKLDILKIH